MAPGEGEAAAMLPPTARRATRDQKINKIGFDLLARTQLSERYLEEFASHDEIVEALLRTRIVRLNDLGLSEIDNLELLSDAVTLYLQDNAIHTIENLEFLTKLEVLSLAHNAITVVPDLSFLQRLVWLDLSHNSITAVRPAHFPSGLRQLSLVGNPCSQHQDYRQALLLRLPELRYLDGTEVTPAERRQLGQETIASALEAEQAATAAAATVAAAAAPPQISQPATNTSAAPKPPTSTSSRRTSTTRARPTTAPTGEEDHLAATSRTAELRRLFATNAGADAVCGYLLSELHMASEDMRERSRRRRAKLEQERQPAAGQPQAAAAGPTPTEVEMPDSTPLQDAIARATQRAQKDAQKLVDQMQARRTQLARERPPLPSIASAHTPSAPAVATTTRQHTGPAPPALDKASTRSAPSSATGPGRRRRPPSTTRPGSGASTASTARRPNSGVRLQPLRPPAS
ncbi:uncharacterized protein MONBRDRAFT_26159 [Monosiga brevicollis MX1]|uniref:U2A'/phosphoprotein 32 family A C-terminal domain-containing protein n=1 Tax=Monosiga brevicollis TaxID=81824 RepID=A9V1J2_MONBE|nr:uncharacterized protein MONBRDRAFT_26159 [Monosiga brevicollis MX1]EDQ88576.1 predicted protein [Monosiga brevicollis MX1]|eukprot:XP_001746680.1 hypothetical protein [Monosiga brevicollis MX1]